MNGYARVIRKERVKQAQGAERLFGLDSLLNEDMLPPAPGSTFSDRIAPQAPGTSGIGFSERATGPRQLGPELPPVPQAPSAQPSAEWGFSPPFVGQVPRPKATHSMRSFEAARMSVPEADWTGGQPVSDIKARIYPEMFSNPFGSSGAPGQPFDQGTSDALGKSMFGQPVPRETPAGTVQSPRSSGGASSQRPVNTAALEAAKLSVPQSGHQSIADWQAEVYPETFNNKLYDRDLFVRGGNNYAKGTRDTLNAAIDKSQAKPLPAATPAATPAWTMPGVTDEDRNRFWGVGPDGKQRFEGANGVGNWFGETLRPFFSADPAQAQYMQDAYGYNDEGLATSKPGIGAWDYSGMPNPKDFMDDEMIGSIKSYQQVMGIPEVREDVIRYRETPKILGLLKTDPAAGMEAYRQMGGKAETPEEAAKYMQKWMQDAPAYHEKTYPGAPSLPGMARNAAQDPAQFHETMRNGTPAQKNNMLAKMFVSANPKYEKQLIDPATGEFKPGFEPGDKSLVDWKKDLMAQAAAGGADGWGSMEGIQQKFRDNPMMWLLPALLPALAGYSQGGIGGGLGSMAGFAGGGMLAQNYLQNHAKDIKPGSWQYWLTLLGLPAILSLLGGGLLGQRR
jgi:hypothetical protein